MFKQATLHYLNLWQHCWFPDRFVSLLIILCYIMFCIKPLSKTVLKFYSKFKHFHWRRCSWICCVADSCYIVQNWTAFFIGPGRFERNFREVIFKLILVIDGWGISCKIALKWLLLNLTDDESTSVQVMALCHQVPSHYMSQCWPRSMSLYGISRPQCVKVITDYLQPVSWRCHGM